MVIDLTDLVSTIRDFLVELVKQVNQNVATQ